VAPNQLGTGQSQLLARRWKTIQSLLLVAAIALLFLVGKYASIYSFSGHSVRRAGFNTGLKER
jgi:hypothetical protein